MGHDLSALSASMMATNPAAAKAWMDMMSEGARFVSARLQEDLEAQKAMLNCKSPTELLSLQTEFFQTAFRQYSEETMRLMQMMSEATGKTVEDAASGHKRGYDDVPL